MADESPARITRVRLKNYKSIVECDVELRPLTILVGPNGSGKSNFVDALRFVSEALTLGLEQAIRNRGNMLHILSEGRPAGSSTFTIDLVFRLESRDSGNYVFEIQGTPDAEFTIASESLLLTGRESVRYTFEHRTGVLWTTNGRDEVVPLPRDRLFLGNHAATLPVYDLLTSMVFYNLNPETARAVRPHELGQRLLPDGANVAGMLRRIDVSAPELVEHISSYLARILPSLREIRTEDLGGYDLLTLRQNINHERGWWDARPDQISDGTLRALGVLVALFQGRMGGKSETSLVGLEEPETGLHPAAARIILSAMQDASYTTQVLATTHSADMLTMGEVDLDSLLVVSAEDGVTRIGPIDEVSRSAVEDHLYTVGELLQADQIRPNGVAPGYAEDTSAAPVAGGS